MSYPGGVVVRMGQDPLFDPPEDLLGRRLHTEVFGSLPALLARELDAREVAAAVRPLLARGWRPAQLGARVGALPSPADPVPAVVAFLQELLARRSPQEAWQQDRADRAAAAEHADGPPPASDEVRAHWVAEARRALGAAARPRPQQPAPPAPTCSSCTGEGAFFVTRTVRLCTVCVELLESGRARLAVSA